MSAPTRTLVTLITCRPWYLVHIYTALKRLLAENLYAEHSPARLQCKELMEAAERDYNNYEAEAPRRRS